MNYILNQRVRHFLTQPVRVTLSKGSDAAASFVLIQNGPALVVSRGSFLIRNGCNALHSTGPPVLSKSGMQVLFSPRNVPLCETLVTLTGQRAA